MDKKHSFAVIGGDTRSIYLIDSLISDGHDVYIHALERQIANKSAVIIGDLRSVFSDVDFIILPMPISKDNKLNAPFCNKDYYVEEVLNLIPSEKTVFAGGVPFKILQKAKDNNINLIDYLKRDELAILNGIPTAEGALQIAMEEMTITIHDSSVLVLGYGNIGKILCRLFDSLGANVTACARSKKDIAFIKTLGYTAVYTHLIDDYLNKFDLIINTIPAKVLSKERLDKISNNCLIIDLASKPGGVDFEEALILSKKVIWARSLPGKVAPQSAAIFIKDTIYNIIREEEENERKI